MRGASFWQRVVSHFSPAELAGWVQEGSCSPLQQQSLSMVQSSDYFLAVNWIMLLECSKHECWNIAELPSLASVSNHNCFVGPSLIVSNPFSHFDGCTQDFRCWNIYPKQLGGFCFGLNKRLLVCLLRWKSVCLASSVFFLETLTLLGRLLLFFLTEVVFKVCIYFWALDYFFLKLYRCGSVSTRCFPRGHFFFVCPFCLAHPICIFTCICI